MLPVSGALQLKTSGPMNERPISSHSGAYSRLLRPAPKWLDGRNRFHKPCARALACSSSITGGCAQREGPAWSCSSYTRSLG
jgi:hypothetical protein